MQGQLSATRLAVEQEHNMVISCWTLTTQIHHLHKCSGLCIEHHLRYGSRSYTWISVAHLDSTHNIASFPCLFGHRQWCNLQSNCLASLFDYT